MYNNQLSKIKKKKKNNKEKQQQLTIP